MKAGIVADNYKVARFDKELAKAGFDDVTKSAFINSTTTITVNAPGHRKDELQKLCEKVEKHFKK